MSNTTSPKSNSTSASSIQPPPSASSKPIRGKPSVSNTKTVKDQLLFTLSNVPVSIANGIRRTMISQIPMAVMKGFPHSESTIHITKNTSRLNNEMLKSRIQCIPVYTQHLDQTINIHDLQVRVNLHNNTDSIVILTTEHFQVFNKKTNQLLPDNDKQKIFPKNEQTNMYIDLVRLHPSVLVESIQNNISNSMTSSHTKQNSNSGDEIEFHADLVYATANEDAAFNSTCTCTYSYTPDPKKLEKEWKFKQKQFASAYDAKAAELDWKIIHAQKLHISNSFDFIIETVGPYTNEAIFIKACDIIQEKLSNTVQFLFENADTNIYLSNKISQYCYDVSFPDSYTIGKLFETELFSLYFQQSSETAESSESSASGTITYCAFVKEHPHSPNSIVRIAFPNQTDNTFIIQCFDTAFKSIIKKIDHIRKYFN